MNATATIHASGHPQRRHQSNRWIQLVAGVVAMMAIASVLFAWPLLRSAPGTGLGLGVSLAAAENAFAAFILAETLFVPLESWLGDRFGRGLLVLGGVLVVLGALAGVHAERLRVAWYWLGGVGAGLVYGGTVAKALKRFTDRKALSISVTAAACAVVAGLAAGAAVIGLRTPGAIQVLIVLGAAQAAVVVIAALFILDPPHDSLPP
jgi:OFA family oxalate/formate antiporter-like MFS transporter